MRIFANILFSFFIYDFSLYLSQTLAPFVYWFHTFFTENGVENLFFIYFLFIFLFIFLF
jgi:hypothetical protein